MKDVNRAKRRKLMREWKKAKRQAQKYDGHDRIKFYVEQINKM